MKFSRTITGLVPQKEKMSETILHGLGSYEGLRPGNKVSQELHKLIKCCVPMPDDQLFDGEKMVKRRVRITIEVENE